MIATSCIWRNENIPDGFLGNPIDVPCDNEIRRTDVVDYPNQLDSLAKIELDKHYPYSKYKVKNTSVQFMHTCDYSSKQWIVDSSDYSVVILVDNNGQDDLWNIHATSFNWMTTYVSKNGQQY